MRERISRFAAPWWKKKGFANDFHPRTIGLSSPGSTFDYEFVVVGKDLSFSQNEIISYFLEQGASILAIDGWVNSVERKCILTVCCSLEKADLGPAELATRLQRTRNFIISVDYSGIDGKLFSGRSSGIRFNGRQSAVAIPLRTFISLSQRLLRELGSSGSAALYREGREYAHSIIHELEQILEEETGLIYQNSNYESESLRTASKSSQDKIEAFCMKCRTKTTILDPKQIRFSNGTHAIQGSCKECGTTVFRIGSTIFAEIKLNPVIENAQAYLQAAGWGYFQLRSEVQGRYGEVAIIDPPTLSDNISTGNKFVQGIAGGLLEIASGCKNEMVFVGEDYDSSSKLLRLHFAERITVKRRASRRLGSINKKGSSNDSEVEGTNPIPGAMSEVDRLINALEKIESGVNITPSNEKIGESKIEGSKQTDLENEEEVKTIVI